MSKRAAMLARRSPALAAYAALCAAAASLVGACRGADLGECDMPAARELVYSDNGMVATKGQALAQDSCGNGSFCHSSGATGSARYGVPHGLDFDMLPSPRGIYELMDYAEAAWDAVESGEMPPRGVASRVLGDGHWSVAIDGDREAPSLAPLASEQGKAAFRNWLACDAPVVAQTRLPPWAQPPRDPFDGGATPTWPVIYDEVLAPKCALAGCHNERSASGGLTMRDACQTHDALLASGTCGQRYVREGDAASSFLMSKLEAATPSCGGPMPPASHGGQLPQTYRDAVREWIDMGAMAEGCP